MHVCLFLELYRVNRSVLKLNDFSHVTQSFCKSVFRKNNHIIGFECKVLTIESRTTFSGRPTIVQYVVLFDKFDCLLFGGGPLSSATQDISYSSRVLRTFFNQPIGKEPNINTLQTISSEERST